MNRIIPSKWNTETISVEVSKYVKLQDFIKGSQGCYLYILKHKEFRCLLNNLELKPVKWNEEAIIKEISKYSTLKEFRENSLTCYHIILRKNLKHLLLYNQCS